MDSKDDEDLSIDFSKVKNFFKSEKKEEAAQAKGEHAPKETKSDDEISFDFKKVKNFFKSSDKESKTDDDVSVNWSSVWHFFVKYGVVFLILIPIILSVYIRMQAGTLAFTDRWAADTVTNGLRSQIKASVDQDFPNLPEANKNTIIENKMQEVFSKNGPQIGQQIAQYSNYFKSFYRDESGRNYMADIDPYYWYRYAKNIVDNGHPGDILKDGRPYDTFQLAPIGRFILPDMLDSYVSAYFYKIIRIFSPNLHLLSAMQYKTVFFSALIVMLTFLVGRRIAGNAGGFFAGLMMAVNGAFLSRSIHPDNDVWVVFFPLLVTWMFIATFDIKRIAKIIILSVFAGLSTAVFAFAWNGWWYIFDFILITIFITALHVLIAKFGQIRKNARLVFSDPDLRNVMVFGLFYLLSSAVFVTVFFGWTKFSSSALGPLSFTTIKAPVTRSLWPNVLTTVAELNEGSIGGIVSTIGGKLFFFISLMGLLLSMSRKDGLKKIDAIYFLASAIFYTILFINFGGGSALYETMSVISFIVYLMLPIAARIMISIYQKDFTYDFKLSILLSLWFVSTIYSSIKGVRFTLLLAPAFSVAFGVALGKTYLYASHLLNREFKVQKYISGGVIIVLFLSIYIAPTQAAINAARQDIPIINDAWYISLTAIKNNSTSDAIITSWWDFGHHFKALAERRVTFDGTTQTFIPAHWVGKILMISDEKEAVGILRMLNCGSHKGFEAVYETNKDTILSVKILNEIIMLGREGAIGKLREYGIQEAQIKKILNYTHCDPPEAYFIASEDMIGKSGVWAHFGSWNFERAEIWQERNLPEQGLIEKMVKKYNYSKEKAENIYSEIQDIENDPDPDNRDKRANSWIAPWPSYGGTMACSKNDNGIYECSNGLLVNMEELDVYAPSSEGIIRPKTAAFTTDNGLIKKEFSNKTRDFGVTIIPRNENEVVAVLSNNELVGGMFTRMFYMQGHGLRYFKPFSHQTGLTGANIYTYKVDWEGREQYTVPEFVKKKTASEAPEEQALSAADEPANLTLNNS